MNIVTHFIPQREYDDFLAAVKQVAPALILASDSLDIIQQAADQIMYHRTSLSAAFKCTVQHFDTDRRIFCVFLQHIRDNASKDLGITLV